MVGSLQHSRIRSCLFSHIIVGLVISSNQRGSRWNIAFTSLVKIVYPIVPCALSPGKGRCGLEGSFQ